MLYLFVQCDYDMRYARMFQASLGNYVGAIHQRLVFGVDIIRAFNQYPHCGMNINSVIILASLSVRWRDLIINITLISHQFQSNPPHQPPSPSF